MMGLWAASRRPTNLAKVRKVVQGPSESLFFRKANGSISEVQSTLYKEVQRETEEEKEQRGRTWGKERRKRSRKK